MKNITRKDLNSLKSELKFSSEEEAIQYLADITNKKIKIATTKRQYTNIVFLQNIQDFDDFTNRETGESGINAFFDADDDEKMKYLYQWEHGDRSSILDNEPWGSGDHIHEKRIGGNIYVLNYSPKYGYAGLTRIIEDLN